MEAFDIIGKYTLDELCLGVSVLLAMSLTLMNQQHILSDCLCTKQGFVLITVVTRGSQKPKPRPWEH